MGETYGLWVPGNVLVPGMNEMLADHRFSGMFVEESVYTFQVGAKMPAKMG